MIAAEVAVWWALLTGLWLITLSSLSAAEEIAAAACALAVAIAVTAARHVLGGAWRPSPAWAKWAGSLLVSIPADTFRVLGLAVVRVARHGGDVHDEVQRLPVPAQEPGAVGAARRALGAFVVSATPGTVVVDWSADRCELVVHRLVRGSPSLEQEVVA